jgi:hypothetical protein
MIGMRPMWNEKHFCQWSVVRGQWSLFFVSFAAFCKESLFDTYVFRL